MASTTATKIYRALLHDPSQMTRHPQIFCPHCAYRPTPEDRWTCVPTCSTQFHTFWTGGVCPGCGWKWEKTQCQRCGEISPHKAWYHWPVGDESHDRAPTAAERTA